jgi:hypothetical protein
MPMQLFRPSGQTTEAMTMRTGPQSRRMASATSNCQNLLGSL